MNTKSPMEEHLGPSKPLGIEVIQTQVKFLQGKVLTIVDASFSDRDQKKAVKDLINKAFSDQLSFIFQLCWNEIEFMSSDKAKSVIKNYDEVVEGAEVLE